MRLNLGKGFREFLSADSKGIRLYLIIFLGIILIFIGSISGKANKVNEAELSTEDRLSQMCSMMVGVGECRVMITYSSEDTVYAVLVLCEGAESPLVRERITDTFTSLYGIGANRVEIQRLNKK